MVMVRVAEDLEWFRNWWPCGSVWLWSGNCNSETSTCSAKPPGNWTQESCELEESDSEDSGTTMAVSDSDSGESHETMHCVKVQGLRQVLCRFGLDEEKVGDFFYAFGCDVSEVFVEVRAGFQTVCNGCAYVVFADAKSVDLAMKLHNSTGCIRSSRPWRRGPRGDLAVDGVLSVERIRAEDQHQIMSEVVGTSQLLHALRRQEHVRIMNESFTDCPDTKCFAKPGTSEETEELTDVGSDCDVDSFDSLSVKDEKECKRHATAAPAKLTLLSDKQTTKETVDSNKGCSTAEKFTVAVAPTVLALAFGGRIKTPDTMKTGAINSGWIELSRNDLEKFRTAHSACNLEWNPHRPDVYFHKQQCCFQPRYGDLVSFKVQLHSRGNMLQAQNVEKRAVHKH